jgi:glycosyltransferase involved in cell wall biosynthesis
MKVLHVVGGGPEDGATRGALWLHRGLLACGVDSRVLTPEAWTQDPMMVSATSGRFQRLVMRLRNRLDSLPTHFYPHRQRRIFSVGRFGLNVGKHPSCAWADVVNLHWVNRGMIAVGGLPSIGKPLVWTLRDMWPLTGGCHYSLECARYTTGCGRCPQLGSRSANDLSAKMSRSKRHFVPKDTVIVGISRWISECARASAALGHLDHRVISNIIDTEVFFPVAKAEARRRLGLPRDARIVLAGSLYAKDFYKGFDLWQAAVAALRHDGLLFAHVGRYLPDPGDPAGMRSFGLIRDDALLRDIYAAADVFVLPSRQEAFGKTGAEALACGTPVVAFDATGPRDIVEHRVTGYLARPFQAADLAAGIRWVLDDRERAARLSTAAAEAARRRFAATVAAIQYRDLYQELLGRRGVALPR